MSWSYLRLTESAEAISLLVAECKFKSTHCCLQMELRDDDGWNIGMPILLDCLRKDIYSLIAKLDLPDEEQVKIGKLIEQIRLEEARYEQDIRKQISEKTKATREEIAKLRERCRLLDVNGNGSSGNTRTEVKGNGWDIVVCTDNL